MLGIYVTKANEKYSLIFWNKRNKGHDRRISQQHKSFIKVQKEVIGEKKNMETEANELH